MQQKLFKEGSIAKPVAMKKILRESVIRSGRWRKWLLAGDPDNFPDISGERQEWLIKTGCRYIWEEPEVDSARAKLYQNLNLQGIDAASIVEARIESAMDRYFHKFNLAGLNDFL
jgi:hypothetical protein